MIHKLKVTNFQKLGSQEFEFGDGLNLIVGPNWAGKSTVLRAILYALGGGRAVKIKNENLITKGQHQLEVQLTLDTGETITRGTKRILVADQDGNTVASGNTAVTEWVEQRFGLTLQDFRAFRVAEQGEPDALLAAGSAALSEHLSRVTGAKIVDSALAWLALENARVSGLLEGLNDSANQEVIDQLPVEIAKLTELVEVTRPNEITEAQQALADARKTLSDWLNYHEALAKRYHAAREYHAKLDTLNAGRTQALTKLMALVEVEEPRVTDLQCSNLDELTAKLAALQQQLQIGTQVEYELNHCTTQIAAANTQIARLTAELSKLPEVTVDLEQLAKDRDDLYQKVSFYANEIRSKNQTIESSVCSACKRPFTDEAAIDLLRQEVISLKAESDASQKLLAQLLTTERQAKEVLTSKADLQTKLTLHTDNLAHFESALSALNNKRIDVTALQAAIHHLTSQKAEVENQLLAYKSYVSNKQLLEATLADFDAKLQALWAERVEPVTVEALTTAKTQGDMIREVETYYRVRLQQLEAHLAAEKARLTTAKHEQGLIAARREARAAQELRLGAISNLTAFLRKNRETFMADLWATILCYANDFISSASGGEMTALLREDGAFKYVENGTVFPIECASGMQTAILGVALKLALGAALGVRSSVLLLDEVTAAGSLENSATFVSLLREQAGQVLLVSHRETDSALADKVVIL